MKPATHYTKSGRINIAYQVFGTGPIDLVYIPGWVSNIDLMWACPDLVNFLEELGKMARVILFDKRGTGLSDRMVELSTLEERMDDIRAVMDAVGSDKAILFGHSEGGSVSALFAATYPNRTLAMISFGIFAKRRYAPNYPWAPTDEERQVVYDMIETSWGSGNMNLESLAPSRANDKAFMEWLANYFRSGASPSAAMVLTKMNTEVDIIDILGSIRVPVLILQRTHDIDVKIEEGKFIAGRIPNAKFIELDGSDHLFWVGNTKQVLAEMKNFIMELKPKEKYDQQLYTIIGARFITEEKAQSAQQKIIVEYVTRFKGKVIQFEGRIFFATFDGPSKAVHCCLGLCETVKNMKAKLSVGIHIKEAALDEADFVSRETEKFVTSILEKAQPNEILITQTVRYLLYGAGLKFSPARPVITTQSGELHALYSVADNIIPGQETKDPLQNKYPQNVPFLENVLHSIDIHIEDEYFGVEKLCKEMGISERQLQRKLKAVTNKSPVQLILSVRLHRAKELMLENKYNINEIAFKAGFSNPSYFSRSFKKEFGINPSEFTQQQT